MNANGQRFWMLASESDWQISSAAAYDSERRCLRLASQRRIVAQLDAATEFSEASGRLERVPQSRDAFGHRAFWDETSRNVMATGALPGAVIISTPPAGERPTDVVVGTDDILYMALNGAVVMHDLRNRWRPHTIRGALSAWRLAADPHGGVWVLDRAARLLGRVTGAPLPERPGAELAPGVFRPKPENPHPPTLKLLADLTWDTHELPIALACHPTTGRVVVLSWVPDHRAQIHVLTDTLTLSPARSLDDARHPFSITWSSSDRIAVMLVGIQEAPVYALNQPGNHLIPSGDLYPLNQWDGGPFVHGVDAIPQYPTVAATAPLHRVSLVNRTRHAHARNRRPLDSGTAQTEWDRLYLEAIVPPACGLVVWTAATDANEPPADDDPQAWSAHRFGHIASELPVNDVVRGAWVSVPSEVPHHAGLLPCTPQPDHVGLFTALIQRSGRRVRTLRGRYLWLRVELNGDGRATPEIAALRAYAPRFSYVNHYLPELYRETELGSGADLPGRCTGADFLGRTLANFEGMLTTLEDRVAHAHILTDPNAAPDEALEWLGSWIGLSFDSAYPSERRRELLAAAPHLFRERGTLRGLSRALEIVTGGGISGGEIVVLEDFRLRHTFATILGADLADENDPLLAGLATSSNSYVGDTLFLGEEHHAEFLSLFSDEIGLSKREERVVAAFFDQLAYRVTVLVHQEVEPQDLGLIRRVVELETPAHVQVRVLTATYPFLVGIAALVGVDTYLGRRPPRAPVTIDRSVVGERDFVRGAASVDPRLGGRRVGSTFNAPIADAGPDRRVPFGNSFTLDASASRAAEGRVLSRFIWERKT